MASTATATEWAVGSRVRWTDDGETATGTVAQIEGGIVLITWDDGTEDTIWWMVTDSQLTLL